MCIQHNFIVSTKNISCFFCGYKFHVSCVGIKDNWHKILCENPNIFWLCEPCKTTGSTNKKFNVAHEVISSENVLLRQLVDEKHSKNVILEENIILLKEKIITLNEKLNIMISQSDIKNNTTRNENKDKTSHMVSYANAVGNDKYSSHIGTTIRQQNAKHGYNTNQQINVNKPPVVSLEQNKSQQTDKINIVSNENTNRIDREWIRVKPKRRRKFMVGQNSDTGNIQTIPKFVSLHVTRLHPKTTPSDLENVLKDRFPDVSCEIHNSRFPDKYKSMKVNIRQENLKEAWQKELWPSGAIISKFFVRRRILSQQIDPQEGSSRTN